MNSKYVALLRGINVGGSRKVPMSELRSHFEELGFDEVQTYINSGNVIFSATTSPDASNIEQKLADCFGFQIDTLVISAKNFRAIAEAIPETWLNDRTQKSDVLFLFSDVDVPETLKLANPRKEYETGMYVPGALLWNLDRKHQSRNSVIKLMGTELYKQMTIRNINTVRRLARLLREG